MEPLIDSDLLAKASILTVDVWDTVLRRTCHPEMIKKLSCDRLFFACQGILSKDNSPSALYRARRRLESEYARKHWLLWGSKEHRLPEVIHALGRRNGLKGSDLVLFVKTAMALEMDVEKECSYPDTTMVEALTASGKKAIYLSDFYAGKKFLDELLAFHGIGHLFKNGYVSCDLLMSKREGRMYRHLNFVVEHDWVHIGDNPHSDIVQAKKHGARPVHYLSDVESSKQELHAKTFALVESGDYWKTAGEGVFGEGAQLAPLFSAFIIALIQKAQQMNLTHVFFFSREGAFFKRLFDEAVASLQLNLTSVLLFVSRKATLFASLPDIKFSRMHLLWSQYPHQSPASLMKSLVPDPNKYRSLFEQAGLDWDTEVDCMGDPRLGQLWGSFEFQRILKEDWLHQRTLLLLYIQQYIEDAPRILVVDIGWRGTIQDNLARLFPSRAWHGIYLGLQPFLNSQLNNVSKHAVFADMNKDSSYSVAQKLSLVAPFEMISNAPLGSTLYYELTKVAVIPVFHDTLGEIGQHQAYALAFQNGVSARHSEIMRSYQKAQLSYGDILDEGQRCWDLVVHRPPPLLKRALLDLRHDETFGVGGFVEFQATLSTKAILDGFKSLSRLRGLVDKAKTIPWHGCLSRDPTQPAVVRAFFAALPLLWWLKQRYRALRRG